MSIESVASTHETESPAERLEGLILEDKWLVLEKFGKEEGINTGGNFSVCYYVRNRENGVRAFLKALDYSKVFKNPTGNLIDILNEHTGYFIYERNVLLKCMNKKIDRVVRTYGFGEIAVSSNPFDKVNYIIFELADNVLRNFVLLSQRLDYAWAIRSLHNITVGIRQLHNNEIAHQDIKPSNILLFNDVGTKIGDMGRTVTFGSDLISPYNSYFFAGDRTYAPFDILYNYRDPEEKRQKYGADLFMLGSLILFYISKTNINESVRIKIRKDYWKENWGGTYQEVIPYLQHAVCEVVEEFQNSIEIENELFKKEISSMVLRLCEPDIERRCYARKSISNPLHDLEYLISRLDYYARWLEYSIRR